MIGDGLWLLPLVLQWLPTRELYECEYHIQPPFKHEIAEKRTIVISKDKFSYSSSSLELRRAIFETHMLLAGTIYYIDSFIIFFMR